MLEKLNRIEDARFVEGEMGVHFVYTAGVAGEEFLRGLAMKKIFASDCPSCSRRYVPPRIFCEACMVDIEGRRTIDGSGRIESLVHVAEGLDGPLDRPESVAAIRLKGSDSTILHRVSGPGLKIGSKVAPVWAAKRTGSILDIKHFAAAAPAAKPKKRAASRSR